jgi:hypothetical protein
MLKNKYTSYNIKKQLSESEKKNTKKICCTPGGHKNPIFEEFLCHLPMAILALCVSLILFTLIHEICNFFGPGKIYKSFYMNIFHVAHYIHILCASFASFYSCYTNTNYIRKNNIILCMIFSLINSIFFCTIADMILPACGSLLFNKNMHIHICLLCKHDFFNSLLFSLFGIFAGFCLERGDKEYSYTIAKKVHLGHVWFGCIASILYLFSQIQVNIADNAGLLFIILFISTLVPCIISDICLPFFMNKYFEKKYINHQTNLHN